MRNCYLSRENNILYTYRLLKILYILNLCKTIHWIENFIYTIILLYTSL